MDGDSYKQEKNINNKLDVSTVFQPLWVRFCNGANIGTDKFLRDYNGYFVPVGGAVLWVICFLL